MKKYFKKQLKTLCYVVSLCSAYAVFNVGIAVLLQYVVDLAAGRDMVRFVRAMLAAGAYIIIFAGIYYAYGKTVNKLSNSMIADLRNDLFSGILKKDYESYVTYDTTAYISTVVNDINLLESAYIAPCIRIMENSIMFVLTVILLLRYGGLIIIWLTFILCLMMVLPQMVGKIMQNKQNRFSAQLSSFTRVLRDYLSGYEVIHTANIENTIIHKFRNENTLLFLRKNDRDKMRSLSDSVACLLSAFMQFSIIFTGVFSIMQGNMTIGILTALLQLCNMFTMPVSAIMQDLSEIKSAKPVLEKIDRFMESAKEKEVCSIREIRTISMKNVCFKYPSQKENTLEIEDLQIHRGKKYLIAGKSGCGKSTLLKLLAGYFKEYEGQILFDGADLRKTDDGSIYQKMAIIHQNVFLFNASLIDNITLWQEYQEQDLENALKISGVDQFADIGNKGRALHVGENGKELSGGQRQRIAIARALIQKKEILILDEGISSIDRQTGNDIENRILNIPGLTIINVSHDLQENSLNQYDEILFIQNGKIAEAGPYQELMSKKGAFQRYITS